ncbi:MAG: tRNA 2-selenouridine(34) synthase MnmH [Schleiferiaceae bacterium]|nr:tRNA 2-selenouridine(34) synthase MnmH [Schleiferiaceae bacterium]
MPLFDVRSPSEYRNGHAPGALSLPMFSDEERAMVGLCFKEKGQSEAIRLGLEIVGPKMASYVKVVDQIAGGKEIELYCWRGGMRSQSMAWLMSTAGYDVTRWEGGYKSYRNSVHQKWFQPRPYVVLAGLTGCGKTEILRLMQRQGAAVFDLEGLANHKGSAFGHVGEEQQPQVEDFENLGADFLEELPRDQALWIEDESRSIGRIWLQNEFYLLKKAAPIVILERSRANRLDHLVHLYGQASPEALTEVFPKIAKRLGHQNAQWAIDAIMAGDLRSAAEIALNYYDRTYAESMEKRKDQVLLTLDLSDCSFEEAATRLLQQTKEPITAWLKQQH